MNIMPQWGNRPLSLPMPDLAALAREPGPAPSDRVRDAVSDVVGRSAEVDVYRVHAEVQLDVPDVTIGEVARVLVGG